MGDALELHLHHRWKTSSMKQMAGRKAEVRKYFGQQETAVVDAKTVDMHANAVARGVAILRKTRLARPTFERRRRI